MTDGLGTASRAQTLDIVAIGEIVVDFIYTLGKRDDLPRSLLPAAGDPG
jgi:hypothetical protein